MRRTLTSGPITSSILLFALPLMFGNLLQQMYNIADTWVVGRFLGADALAAGIREGVAVGAALEELLEKVIEGTLPNSRGVLLEQLASMGGTGADSCEQESLF